MLMHAGVDVRTLRQREFSRLDASSIAYLDYAGAALHPASIVRRDAARLQRSIFGNPHSENAPSRASTAAMEDARAETLRFFGADAREYDLVFTANASSAMRILAEAFPFGAGSRLVLTADNHNSVNGLRVPAVERGADVQYVPLDADLRAADPRPWLRRAIAPSLFAYPAQSNFSGVRHSLHWVKRAHSQGYHVLLDAAAYVSSSALSLADVPADFVAISYYKLFGYPTGVGALLVRRDALAVLRRRYFAGGTVDFVSVQNDRFRPRAGAAAFEDGTPPFLAMPAVRDGLRWLTRIGMDKIQQHVCGLTASLLDRFASCGDRVHVYGPVDTQNRGGIVAFNLTTGGRVVDYEIVEAAARERGIAIRGGCFCNPGAAEHAFGFNADRARDCLRAPFSIPRFRACMDGTPVGALRASIGVATSEGDLDRLLQLAADLT
ncbi:MAG TPA: aminotransferase class V-fold PLP-dependent enzyme [Vicinamibacterales bacterium]|jgi:selenocysteine lyase/cysteine desulfurase